MPPSQQVPTRRYLPPGFCNAKLPKILCQVPSRRYLPPGFAKLPTCFTTSFYPYLYIREGKQITLYLYIRQRKQIRLKVYFHHIVKKTIILLIIHVPFSIHYNLRWLTSMMGKNFYNFAHPLYIWKNG